MRRTYIGSAIVLLMSISFMAGCRVSYKDYTYRTQDYTTEAESVDVNREYRVGNDAAKLPYDAVFIDDYSNEGTIRGRIQGKELSLNIKINKVIVADDITAYTDIGGTHYDLLIEWIKRINAIEAGLTNKYNEDDGTFDSGYEGVNTKIFMISAELINNWDNPVRVDISGLHIYNVNREKGECARLSIRESRFDDYSGPIGLDRGYITLQAGERRNVVLIMVEPDKIIHTYRIENGKNIVTDAEDINYDNLYIRLSLSGVQQIYSGENFIKLKTE